MGAHATQETLALLKLAQKAALPDEIAKAFNQAASPTQGLTAYDLQAPALTLYPVLTPLRNKIPRVSGKGGTQASWRAITGINVNNLAAGVAEGRRGGVIATSTSEYVAAYRGLGLEDYVSFEAEYAAEGFDDVKARAVEGLLRSLMIGEEGVILGGNTSMPLGTTPQPTLIGSTTGGSLATGTLSVVAVGLGFDAFWALGGWNNGQQGSTINLATAQVPTVVNRSNADGTSDSYGGGAARKSTAATVSITGPNGSATASVVPMANAVAYAWYWGAAGAEVLGAVTTINSVSITANASGTQTAASLPASDNSVNSLEFDGILTQIAKSGSGAYVKTLPTGTPGVGSTLTADNAGGIVELEDAFFAFWSQYRLSPEVIYVNAQQLLDMNRKILIGGGAPLVRFNLDGNNPGAYNPSAVIGSYLNKITNTQVKIEVHPNVPPGTILFWSDNLPYKLSGIQNAVQIRTRRDYYQLEWPLRTRKYEYGVYTDQVLQNFFPPAFGIITNIARG
ncbi:hypothetical protein [Leeia aquatica]|uniref:Uncharacterized protein n=1 Tax=Leeia aquatica TaxID=2725557 RepID=A0A847S519_9NEIS|nr:hypothetical protein [Leeia aquatica]NLR74217.1 hypothetical protein [Leeia aquatica]